VSRRAAALGRPVRVLVVDASAVVRQALKAILSAAGMEVEVAADPIFARAKMDRVRPDVLVLDVEMPRMDGLTFLRQIMAGEHPLPVIMCSSLAGPGTEVVLQALEEGAVAVVEKPRLDVRGFLEQTAERMQEAVAGAVGARLLRRAPPPERRHDLSEVLPSRRRPVTATTDKVVAIGASTGGTEAIRAVLERMPPDAPAIAIVQHMPEVFTAAFARRLNSLCRIEVKEAAPGDHLCSGRALIAPGNHHLSIRRDGGRYAVEVLEGPPVNRHRPSVDVLFRSAAQAAGPNALGVILTGMGDDGALGLLEMRQAGGHTIAQDEASSVVFGMPGEAIKLGAACEIQPLEHIAQVVLRRVG